MKVKERERMRLCRAAVRVLQKMWDVDVVDSCCDLTSCTLLVTNAVQLAARAPRVPSPGSSNCAVNPIVFNHKCHHY